MKRIALGLALLSAVAAQAAPTFLQCEGPHYQFSGYPVDDAKFPVVVDIQARTVDILSTIYRLTSVDDAFAEARLPNGQFLSLDRVNANIVLFPSNYVKGSPALINASCERVARKL